MDTLENQVVVVTGGASGIGLALARAASARGARVVIADIEQAALDAVPNGRDGLLADALTVRTDVSQRASVEALRDEVLERLGRVDVVCNNAGVATFNLLADQTAHDWTWVLGVNLWGVIHGVDVFLPVLKRQGTAAHIVNTASIAGLVSAVPFLGPYAASKAAVVSISETLRQELIATGDPIGVSVVCPSGTTTNVTNAERNRPPAMGVERRTADAEAWRRGIRDGFDGPNGLPPEIVADRVVEAILSDEFWVITHDDMKPLIEGRSQEILAKIPSSR